MSEDTTGMLSSDSVSAIGYRGSTLTATGDSSFAMADPAIGRTPYEKNEVALFRNNVPDIVSDNSKEIYGKYELKLKLDSVCHLELRRPLEVECQVAGPGVHQSKHQV